MNLGIETHDKELLTGDAFAVDRKALRAKGSAVTQFETAFGASDERETIFSDTPESKCNAVSFTKPEAASLLCRNVVAVNERYICYSVKKTMLRVIHQVSTNKGLLKNHQHPILDVRFSTTNEAILCSADAGDGAGAVNVWSIDENRGTGDLSNSLVFHAPLAASIVQSYPLLSGEVWVLAHEDKFGIISSRVAGDGSTDYSKLVMNGKTLSGNSIISDLCFSADCSTLAISESSYAAGTTSQVTLWGLPSSQSLLQCSEPLAGPSRIISINTTGGYLCCRFLNSSDLLTCTMSGSGGYSGKVDLQLWYGTANPTAFRGKPSDINKAVQTLTLQLPKSETSGSPFAPSLACSLATALPNKLSSQAKFACFTSRESQYVAVLGIAKHDPTGVYPLSSSIGHISAVNLKAPIFSMSTTCVELRDDHHSEESVEHLEMSCFQETSGNAGQSAVQQYHVASQLLAPASTHAMRGAPLWYSPELYARPPVPGLENFSKSATSEPSRPPAITASLTPPAAGTTVPSKGGGDLFSKLYGMLGNKQAAASSPVPVSPKAADPSASAAATPVAAAPAVSPTGLPAGLGPSSASPLTGLQTSAQSKSLLDMVKSKSGSNGGLPVDAFKSSSTPVAASAIAAVSIPPQAPTDATRSSAVRASSIGSDLGSEDETWAAAARSVLDLEPAPTRDDRNSASASVSVSVGVKSEKPSGTVASAASSSNGAGGVMSSDVVSSLAALTSAVAKLTDDKAQRKQAESLSTAVGAQAKKAVESEVRRVLDNKAFRDEIASSISATLQAELTAVVSSKVKDTVRETVKSALQSAFRTAFENSLLPAFQAGTDRLYGQLQTSFEQGVEGLVDLDRERGEEQRGVLQAMLAMQSEVSALRSQMSSIESKLASQGTGAGAAPAAAAALADPLALLAAGRVAEAVEATLEQKNTELLVKVLSGLSAADVVKHCSVVVLLCTTQQLAVDLATTEEPIEVRGFSRRVLLCFSLPSSTQKSPPLAHVPPSPLIFATPHSITHSGLAKTPRMDQIPCAASRIQCGSRQRRIRGSAHQHRVGQR